AAANARAVFDRPDPGGPVKSQAWVIPDAVPPASTWPAAVTARRKVSAVGCCPTRSSQTLTDVPPGRDLVQGREARPVPADRAGSTWAAERRLERGWPLRC